MAAVLVLFGVAVAAAGLTTFRSWRRTHRRRHTEEAFWIQVRRRPALYDWADEDDLP